MREDRSSDTALGVTIVRAVHQLVDGVPRILEDPVSLRLLGEEAVQAIREDPERHRALSSRVLRSHIVLRSRYAEDELSRAVASGIAQFVNLGAGYDTFPFRQPGWARSLRIVEADHPATQAAKMDLLGTRGIVTPMNVQFVSLDLESGDLGTTLAQTSLDQSLRTFVSCLGVLAYLQFQTVRKVFRAVAAMPRGSVFVLAFAPRESEGKRGAAERAAALGEPWLTRFDVDDLKWELQESGFADVSFLTPEEARERYYPGQGDLPAPEKIRLCRAVV